MYKNILLNTTYSVLLKIFWRGVVYMNYRHGMSKQWHMSPSTTKPTQQCVPSKDSDQAGHSPSLIRVFAVHMKKVWVPKYQKAHSEDWSDWTDLSRHWAHKSFCWFCHVVTHMHCYDYHYCKGHLCFYCIHDLKGKTVLVQKLQFCF